MNSSAHNPSHPEGNGSLPGVYPASRKDGTPYFRASMTYRMKHISLGSYANEASAHAAYLEGRRLTESGELTDYRPDSPLAFDKWVTILNFRDHGIYIGTPIYLEQRRFRYYLSPDEILIFDRDDLFYFSSHRISRRGGHLFVADYGLQISLASRYGIKPYAVPGVDYCFRNGDPLDYRRENLEIRNIYHGVRAQGSRFLARIHVNGYRRIGVYDSALEAAIAYNKAIDLLGKKGIRRGYTPNYIDEIPPRAYADIYASLPVAPYFSE